MLSWCWFSEIASYDIALTSSVIPVGVVLGVGGWLVDASLEGSWVKEKLVVGCY